MSIDPKTRCADEALHRLKPLREEATVQKALSNIKRLKSSHAVSSGRESHDTVLSGSDQELRSLFFSKGLSIRLVKATEHFLVLTAPRLKRVPSPPSGYAFKGGAARLALLAASGMELGSKAPRDQDLVRVGRIRDLIDEQVAKRRMAEDEKLGHGVELLTCFREHLSKRDITINEVLLFPEKLICSRTAFADSLRRELRPSAHLYEQDPSSQLLITAKLLRLKAEFQLHGEEFSVSTLPDAGELSPFALFLHLSRSLETSSRLAEQYLKACRDAELLPAALDGRAKLSDVLDWGEREHRSVLRKFSNLKRKKQERSSRARLGRLR